MRTEEPRRPTIQIELTPEQLEQIRQATGREVPALALRLEELEERIVPGKRLN
jgi:hypothetical protein